MAAKAGGQDGSGPAREQPTRDRPVAGQSPGEPGNPDPQQDTLRAVTLIGQRIGGFTVRSLLKATGMSEVYVAEQVAPYRRVALKVMRGGPLRGDDGDAAFVRFSNEAEIIAQLRHPHIAHVYEAGLFTPPTPAPPRGLEAVDRSPPPSPEPYFAMLYVPGAQPITSYARAMELGVRERLALMVRVCDAVHHAHRQGVIHRDIKPGNVLVDDAGHPYVIDFGVAFAVGLMPRVVREDERGAVVGTPSYLSPEQTLRDPEQVDHRSDVYALGVLLYELVVGRHPLDLPANGPTDRTLEIIRRGEIRDPVAENPHLRGDLAGILRTALATDRDRRFASAEELKQALERYLRLSASPTPSAGVLGTARSSLAAFARRRPLLSRLLLALVVAFACQGLLPRLVAEYTPVQRWFESMLMRGPIAGGTPAGAAGGGGGGAPARTLDSILVVGVSRSMDERELARLAGVRDEGTASLVWRRLFAAAVDRLAAANAGAVAVMGNFPTDEGIEPLVESVQRANAAGTPVWVRSPDWRFTPGEKISRRLTEVPVAPMVGDIEPGTRWSTVLAWRAQGAPGEMSLSLSLAMYAALARPGAAVEAVTPALSERGLTLRYSIDDPAAPKLRRQVVRTELLPISAVQAVPESAEGGAGLAVYQAVMIPSDAALRAATMPLADLFGDARQLDALRAKVVGRAVFIMDPGNAADFATAPDGRRLSTEWLAPLTTQSLRDRAALTWPGPALTWSATLTGAALGVLGVWALGWCWAGFGPVALGAVLIGLTGLLVAASLLAFGRWGLILNPAVPTATLLIAALLAVLLPPRRWPLMPPPAAPKLSGKPVQLAGA